MQEDINLGPYLRTLVARWRLILGVVVLTTAAAAVVAFVTPSTYEATAGLLILKSRTTATFDSDIRTVTEADLADVDRTARRRAMAELVKSPDVEARVVKGVGDELAPAQRKPGALMGQVEVSTGPADVIEVRVKSGSPRTAARVANVWAQEAADYINEVYSSPNQGIATAINEQITQASQRYEQAVNALVEFQGKTSIPALTAQVSGQQSTLDYYATRELERAQLLERARLLREQVTDGANAATLNAAVTVLLSQAASYTSLPIASSQPIERRTPLQLQVQAAGTAPTLEALGHQLDAFITALEAQEQEQQTEKPEQQALVQIRAAQRQLEAEQEQLRQLQQARDIAWEAYGKLERRAEEISVNLQVPTSEVRFALSAIEPTVPKNVSVVRAVVLGLLMGLMLGVAGAFLADLVAGGSQRLVPAKAS
ncbi:MAG: Wzz/FepE/Etk N-terminal domain-containing protein [Ardenticatenaceae bacterium]|nr:Wzz/FepE/Etk N-terminal domain-containing protein [Ardenticatenaceae bacterium]